MEPLFLICWKDKLNGKTYKCKKPVSHATAMQWIHRLNVDPELEHYHNYLERAPIKDKLFP